MVLSLLMLSMYHTLKCFVVAVAVVGATGQNCVVKFVVGVVLNRRCCVNESVPVFLDRCLFC